MERFASIQGYELLLQSVQALFTGEVETWLADWLMQPSLAFGAVPLAIADQPGGVQSLIVQSHRVVVDTGA